MLETRTLSLLGVVLILALVLSAGTAAAEVEMSSDTEYSGGESGSDQAITTEVTISPVNHEIADAEIVMSPTDQTFLDTNSFSRTFDPGDSDVDIEVVGDNTYRIDRLGPDESITIRYAVYPKDIKQESIDSSVASIEYVQQGQTLSDSMTVSADLSNSPWFRYVNERDRPDDGGGGSNAAALLMGLVFLAIVGAAVVIVYVYYLE